MLEESGGKTAVCMLFLRARSTSGRETAYLVHHLLEARKASGRKNAIGVFLDG